MKREPMPNTDRIVTIPAMVLLRTWLDRYFDQTYPPQYKVDRESAALLIARDTTPQEQQRWRDVILNEPHAREHHLASLDLIVEPFVVNPNVVKRKRTK